MSRIPMPSPRGTNYERLFLPAGFCGGLAFDQLPRNAIEAGRSTGTSPAPRRMDNGNRGVNGDQDEPDVVVANSQIDALMVKLFALLDQRLNPDELADVQNLLMQMFDATAPKDANGNSTSSVAQDSRFLTRFPNANRLLPRSTGPSSRAPAQSYEQRFPDQGRLLRRIF